MLNFLIVSWRAPGGVGPEQDVRGGAGPVGDPHDRARQARTQPVHHRTALLRPGQPFNRPNLI